ncbi:uncharacterized protein J3D65DRAFT_238094 [Phyllosticta citribraziliensis]|uniref:Uncharacterized protein n=1 Tax=Phyllosticta citribraziliensis TaxID=989973 RepID=A0ABR1M179_9PEZI
MVACVWIHRKQGRSGCVDCQVLDSQSKTEMVSQSDRVGRQLGRTNGADGIAVDFSTLIHATWAKLLSYRALCRKYREVDGCNLCVCVCVCVCRCGCRVLSLSDTGTPATRSSPAIVASDFGCGCGTSRPTISRPRPLQVPPRHLRRRVERPNLGHDDTLAGIAELDCCLPRPCASILVVHPSHPFPSSTPAPAPFRPRPRIPSNRPHSRGINVIFVVS